MEIKFLYVGWCCETDAKGREHDKIWASFQIGNTYYACWGARGKTVNFKKHDSRYSLSEVERTKRKKYDEVSPTKLLAIWPDFYESVEKRLCFCVLANKIK